MEGEREFKSENDYGFYFGSWHVICSSKKLIIRKEGIDLATKIRTKESSFKIIAASDEGLEKIIFDTDKKTVSVKVKNPRNGNCLHLPKTVDLSEDEDFFEYLHQNLDKWMMEKGEFTSVTPNEDRTVFEVK